MDRKKFEQYLGVPEGYLGDGAEDFSETSSSTLSTMVEEPDFLPIKQHRQYSPSIYYAEGKFILNITLDVDGRPFNVAFELSADQVANLNSQCAKSLVPHVYYGLRREVSR